MKYKKYIKEAKPEMEKSLEYLKKELDKIRADRATPSLVEDIVVDAFDQKMPLKQMAAISCPEERQIVIEPWNKDYIKAIVNAIQKANSELNPMPQGKLVRVNLPPMTKEYRQKLVKKLSEIREDARISVKRAREEAWKKVQEAEKDGEITEDDKYRGKDELQDLVDEYNRKIDELVEKKKEKIQK
ncbi:MAG: ribosome recycling factor [Patescibacteria group bacterium]